MTSIARYQFHVKSTKRSSGTNTDLDIKMNQILTLKSANGYFRVRVEGATIPFSFYQLSSSINTLQVELTNGGSKNVVITIPPGNYTTTSVLNLFKELLSTTAQVTDGTYIGFNPTLLFSYSSSTGRDTLIMSDVGPSITLRFDLNQDLGRFFGFETSQTISSSNSPVSTKIAVSNPVYQLYLRSGNLQQLYNREYIVEEDVYSDIFYTIPITTNTNTYIQINHSGDEISIRNNDIQSINWYLTTNLSYDPIDLQGLDFNFVFTIDEIEQVDYKPRVASDLLTSRAPVPVDVESLQTEKEEIMKKLDVYKRKLSRGIPENLLSELFATSA